jgi:lipopolysaccharide assembly protein A
MASSDPTQAGVKRSRRETARTAAMVVLAVIVTLFAVLNVKQVEVNWIFGKTETPLIIVIVASLLVGILFTHFAEARNRRKSS